MSEGIRRSHSAFRSARAFFLAALAPLLLLTVSGLNIATNYKEHQQMSGATLNFAGNPCNCKEDQPAEFLETIYFSFPFLALFIEGLFISCAHLSIGSKN
jgi:hypothetical protein